jgi:polysaccharide deacetylase 2 family uncharacterized protein YibQ
MATMFIVMCPQSMGADIKQQVSVPKSKKVAIVIDDLGNNMSGTDEIMAMQIPLTVAVRPFMPTTKRDAEWAHRVGHEVLVHLPMEPLKGKKQWLGPGAITSDLSDEEIRRRVRAAIDDVPYAIGVNNHMGSKITADARMMKVVLEVCKERGLFFLDSKTNYWSIVDNVAKQVGVSCVDNHIFLDDKSSKRYIMKQMKLIQSHLSHHNHCIAIGHVGRPGKNTAFVIKASIPVISKEADFVPISKLVPHHWKILRKETDIRQTTPNHHNITRLMGRK